MKKDLSKESYDVFLSHSSVDKQWVIKLKSDLQVYSVSVWLDRDEIRPGDLFCDVLEQAIDNCNSVALVVSPDSLESGWVKEEYNRAIAITKKKGLSLQIIPVILREAELPGFLSTRNAVDFRDESCYSQRVYDLVWGITGTKPENVIHLETRTKNIDLVELPPKEVVATCFSLDRKNKVFSNLFGHTLSKKILNDIHDIIALHGLDDDDWSKAISAQYFLVGLGQLLNMTSQDDFKNLLNKFLRSFYHQVDGTIVLEDSHILVTPEETQKMFQCMKEEDEQDSYYTRTARMRSENIDMWVLHYNYLYGLAVRIGSAAKQYKILQEIHQLALDKLIYGTGKSPLDSYGGWYPYRVPWVTARILISIRFADLKSREDFSSLEEIIQKSLRSLVRRIYKDLYWRSGVGSWVTQWESTALCLEALEEWEYISECKTEIRRVLKYVIDNQDQWMVEEPDFSTGESSNQTLAAVSLISVVNTILGTYFNDEEFSLDYDRQIKYLEKCVNAIQVTTNPDSRQFCTIPQVAYYIVRSLLDTERRI